MCCHVLHCVACAVRCSVLLCVAVCCSVLLCVAVCSRCTCTILEIKNISETIFWMKKIRGMPRLVARELSFILGILLQCVVVGCSVLQCVAVCCSVLQCAAVCCRVSRLRRKKIPKIIIHNWMSRQCVAVRCKALQWAVARCSALQCVPFAKKKKFKNHNPLLNYFWQYIAVSLKCIAVCCSVLQCVAVCSICEGEKFSEKKIHN